MSDRQPAIIHEHYHVTDAGMRAVLDGLIGAISRHKPHMKQYLWYSPQKYQHRPTPFETCAEIPVEGIEDTALGYRTHPFSNEDAFDRAVRERVAKKSRVLQKLLQRHGTLVHLIQNPTLLKNPVETRANALIAEAMLPQAYLQIWQIHDLLEKGATRAPLRARIKVFGGPDTERIFGPDGAGLAWSKSPNIIYAAINRKTQWAIGHLLHESLADCVFYFPNAVDPIQTTASAPALPTAAMDEAMARFCRRHHHNGNRFDPDAELLIAAELARTRKNTGEQLLILNLLNAAAAHTGRRFQLLVTMLPQSGPDMQRIERFQAYIQKYQMPVMMGFGPHLISRSHRRAPGKMILADLWRHERALAALSTSVSEGFGLNFVQPAMATRDHAYTLPTVGRRLKDLFADFEAMGMQFPTGMFYDTIPIDASVMQDALPGIDIGANCLQADNRRIPLGRDFCDYGAAQQVALMERIDFGKLRRSMGGLASAMLDKPALHAVANQNAQAVGQYLSVPAAMKRFDRMIARGFALRKQRRAAGERPAMIRYTRRLKQFVNSSASPPFASGVLDQGSLKPSR